MKPRRALITGGASGFGLSTAKALLAQGAQVAIADIDPVTADATATEIGPEAFGLAMDVSAKASVLNGMYLILERLGQLDILVNNAGYLVYTDFETCSEEDWDRIVNINMKGTFLCAQAAISPMKAKQSGVITNMTSLAAKTGGLAAGPPYAAAKAGVHTLTIGLARALAPENIRVNAIAPCVIDTAMTSAPQHDALKATIPIGHPGQPEDIAHCALFLASDDSKHITGETIDVNGGLYMD